MKHSLQERCAATQLHPDWLCPQWPAPARVHALCSTRAGGTSGAAYQSMNLGEHVGDLPMAVVANRTLLEQAIGARPVFLSQVHGTQVTQIERGSADGSHADASLTIEHGLACTILVADCLPLLLTNVQGTAVAAAHAGWRGLAGLDGRGIVEQLIHRFRALAAVQSAQEATEIIAWLGPCIGPQAFEVGSEVHAVFIAQDAAAAALFTPVSDQLARPDGSRKWLANLPGLARRRLAKLGVAQIYGNDGSKAWCTFSNPARFFSYRRDGITGRMAACIWLD